MQAKTLFFSSLLTLAFTSGLSANTIHITNAYSQELDLNEKELPAKKIQFAKTVKEKNGIRIVGDDLDVKTLSIKEARKLLKSKNITVDKKHKKITILKNTKGQVVYIGKNMTPKEVQKVKDNIEANYDLMHPSKKVLTKKATIQKSENVNVLEYMEKTSAKRAKQKTKILTASKQKNKK